MPQFAGIIPAVMTPFRAEGSIDHGALASLVEWLLGHGVHGVVAIGTMGEYRSLSDEERTAVVTTIVGQVEHRVPVTVGVSADAAAQAAQQARMPRPQARTR